LRHPGYWLCNTLGSGRYGLPSRARSGNSSPYSLRDCAQLLGEWGCGYKGGSSLANGLDLSLSSCSPWSVCQLFCALHGPLLDKISSLLSAKLAGQDLLSQALQRPTNSPDCPASCAST
jgi:hypothetical protein